MPQAAQTAAGRRPTRAGRRRDLRRPKGPKVSSWLHLVSPIRFMALSTCTGSPLRCLSEGRLPAFSRHCSSRKISTPNWRDRSALTQKSTSRLRATGGQVPAGRPAKWPGENVDEPSSPAFTTGQQQLSSKIIGHVRGRARLGRFDYGQFCVQGNRVQTHDLSKTPSPHGYSPSSSGSRTSILGCSATWSSGTKVMRMPHLAKNRSRPPNSARSNARSSM